MLANVLLAAESYTHVVAHVHDLGPLFEVHRSLSTVGNSPPLRVVRDARRYGLDGDSEGDGAKTAPQV
jgi:hypothetical protein